MNCTIATRRLSRHRPNLFAAILTAMLSTIPLLQGQISDELTQEEKTSLDSKRLRFCKKRNIAEADMTRTYLPLDKLNNMIKCKVDEEVVPEADKLFPEAKLKQAKKEAEQKYQLIVVGDTVTILVKQGRRHEKISGVYRGLQGSSMFVGTRKIHTRDIADATMSKLDEQDIRLKRQQYIREHYTEPRTRYIHNRSKDLKEQIYAKEGYIFSGHLKRWLSKKDLCNEYVDACTRALIAKRNKIGNEVAQVRGAQNQQAVRGGAVQPVPVQQAPKQAVPQQAAKQAEQMVFQCCECKGKKRVKYRNFYDVCRLCGGKTTITLQDIRNHPAYFIAVPYRIYNRFSGTYRIGWRHENARVLEIPENQIMIKYDAGTQTITLSESSFERYNKNQSKTILE